MANWFVHMNRCEKICLYLGCWFWPSKLYSTGVLRGKGLFSELIFFIVPSVWLKGWEKTIDVCWTNPFLISYWLVWPSTGSLITKLTHLYVIVFSMVEGCVFLTFLDCCIHTIMNCSKLWLSLDIFEQIRKFNISLL